MFLLNQIPSNLKPVDNSSNQSGNNNVEVDDASIDFIDNSLDTVNSMRGVDADEKAGAMARPNGNNNQNESMQPEMILGRIANITDKLLENITKSGVSNLFKNLSQFTGTSIGKEIKKQIMGFLSNDSQDPTKDGFRDFRDILSITYGNNSSNNGNNNSGVGLPILRE